MVRNSTPSFFYAMTTRRLRTRAIWRCGASPREAHIAPLAAYQIHADLQGAFVREVADGIMQNFATRIVWGTSDPASIALMSGGKAEVQRISEGSNRGDLTGREQRHELPRARHWQFVGHEQGVSTGTNSGTSRTTAWAERSVVDEQLMAGSQTASVAVSRSTIRSRGSWSARRSMTAWPSFCAESRLRIHPGCPRRPPRSKVFTAADILRAGPLVFIADAPGLAAEGHALRQGVSSTRRDRTTAAGSPDWVPMASGSSSDVTDRLLFARMGWCEFYNGTFGDEPRAGGEYNFESVGSEWNNFRVINGRVYGYVHPTLVPRRITGNSEERLRDVAVALFAKNPETGGQYLVGWHRHARVNEPVDYRDRPGGDNGIFLGPAPPQMLRFFPNPSGHC